MEARGLFALDVVIQIALVVVTTLFGAMVLLAAPRRAANVALAAFFFLIAANQGVESLRRSTDDLASPLFWSAAVFAAMDPLALYYFVAIYPKRNRLHSAGRFGVVLAIGWLIALAAGWQGALQLAASTIWLATAAFTSAVYTLLFAHFVRRSMDGEADPALRLLLPAFAIAAVPTWGRTAEAAWAVLATGQAQMDKAIVIASVALVLTASIGVFVTALRLRPRVRRAAVLGTLAGAAIGLLPVLRVLGEAGLFPVGTPRAIVWGAVAARWLGFGLLVSIAVLRYDYLGMSLRARRRTARAIVAGSVLASAALVLASARLTWGDGWVAITIAEVGVVAILLAISQGFRRLVDRVAEGVYGVPMPGDTAASLERYRNAVEASARVGKGFDELVRLREELGLDPRSAAIIEKTVKGESGRIAAGTIVGGRYVIAQPLARGGQSTTFLAREGDRRVVIKELHAYGSAQALAETRAASMTEHPNVLKTIDIVDEDGKRFLVTEFAVGGSLDEHLVTSGPMPSERGVAVLAAILDGLAEVHRKGIVHGDLKPANILLDARGEPKIADFGLARFLDEATAALGVGGVPGTPAYLAPELRRGERATPASDLYAVALIARRIMREMPPSVEHVLLRASHPDPKARFADATSMRHALLRSREADAGAHDPHSPSPECS